MAAVGQPMDDSYAERARKATAAPKYRNNTKSMVSQNVPELVGAPSSSTSETLDSSPALSTVQTATTSLALAPSVPISSASSNQASPVRSSPRNAWSERGPPKTPQRAQPTQSLAAPYANSDNFLIKSGAAVGVRPDDGGHTATKSVQKASTRTKNDPFVVKYNNNPPNLGDTQSWPQIGESSATSSSPRHTRPSTSSVSSQNLVSGSQTPANPASESEGDQSSVKRKAGERTKWVAIPAKELQAAVDEVERRRTPSLKGHSPHLNGHGRRDNVPNSRGVRESGPLVNTINTKHDRNPSLGVRSSSSSRRVSPLHLTASLPSPSTNLAPDYHPAPTLPSSHHVKPQPERPFYDGSAGSGTGNQFASSPSTRYSPWQTPTFTPYNSGIHVNQTLSRSPAKGSNGAQRRQRRRRRPTPREAPPLAGFRANAVVILRSEEYPPVVPIDDTQEVNSDLRPILSPRTKPRTRSPWWSFGISIKHVERWHRGDSSLLSPELNGHDLSSVTNHNFFSLEEVSDSLSEEALQGSSPRRVTFVADGVIPGSGPSRSDIDFAMQTPILSTYTKTGDDIAVHDMPTPSRPGPRGDWAPQGDGSSAAVAHRQPAYLSMNYSPIATENPASPRPIYSGDDRGRGRWRGDERGSRGRGRGFPSRGRGFRGAGPPRPFNPSFGQPPVSSQYPGGQFPHATTLYIPEPTLQPPFYSYPSPVAPPAFAPYSVGPMPAESGASLGKPPSPRPLTHLTFHMEDTRYKLLGQIEYYFSRENVARDVYLRERMDSKGWVPLQVLQSFPRIQSLRVSDDMIRETLQWSQFVEVRQSHVRMALEEWRHYVLPTAAESTVPDIPQHWYPQPVYSPYMAGMPSPFYGYPPPPFPYYPPIHPEESNTYSNGIAEQILRRPEERVGANGAQESGTSGGNSIHSTPNKVDGEELETSEDDVVFVIGDPSPMVRPSAGPADSKWT